MTVTDRDIVITMGRYGGSFAQALAEAFYRADADNFARLKAAFPEIWENYRELATLAASQEGGRS
jgi:hypothetical protein